MFCWEGFDRFGGGLVSCVARACKKCETCFFALMTVFLICSYPSVSKAAICFLPDCNDEKEMIFDDTNVEYCLADGYSLVTELTCPEYNNVEYCPESSDYIKCNPQQWCLDNGYELTECNRPEYLTDQCPNGEVLYMYCTNDFLRACQELDEDYVLECEAGYTKSVDGECPYSSDYGKCCNMCEDFEYLEREIGQGYQVGDSCVACGGITMYKRVVNECAGFQPCPDGGKLGSSYCWHGDEKWYETCCENLCTLDTCPVGTECTYETCSEKYCAVGCLTGYDNYCDTPVMDCVALGYVDTYCEGIKMICPYDSGRFLCLQVGDETAKKWCQDNGYVVTSCTPPTYLSEQCPTDAMYYKTCASDTQRACSELNSDYVASCPEGYEKDSTDLCSYDNTYGSCCNLCSDYPYTLDQIPSGYLAGDSCEACGGVTKYKKVPDTCTGFYACPDGAAHDATTCLHGDEIWYSSCCAYACTLDACPSGTECEYEECSLKYCAVGCSTNYIDYCSVPEMDCSVLGYKATSCSGEKLICPYDSGKFYCINIGA